MFYLKPIALLAIAQSVLSQVTASQSAELTAIVDDINNNLNDYLGEIQDGNSPPAALLSLYQQVQTYTDDSYTSLYSDVNMDDVSSYITGLPWYSTRLQPAIESATAGSGSGSGGSSSGSDASSSSGSSAAESSSSAAESSDSSGSSSSSAASSSGSDESSSSSAAESSSGSSSSSGSGSGSSSSTSGGSGGGAAASTSGSSGSSGSSSSGSGSESSSSSSSDSDSGAAGGAFYESRDVTYLVIPLVLMMAAPTFL